MGESPLLIWFAHFVPGDGLQLAPYVQGDFHRWHTAGADHVQAIIADTPSPISTTPIRPEIFDRLRLIFVNRARVVTNFRGPLICSNLGVTHIDDLLNSCMDVSMQS
jgi:hypothetical protein